MNRKNIFWNTVYTITFAIVFQLHAIAQEKSFNWNENDSKENVVMTWNKNTPETEMKDDIKALADYGVTIKYSDVKRNSKREITAIKVEYSDKNGNKGSLNYDNKKPIPTIKFYKNGDEVGFGEASTMGFANVDSFFNNFAGGTNAPRNFKFQFENDSLSAEKFDFQFPDSEKMLGQSNSKIIIKKDGKKPLVIENGEVIEGAEDYTPEEIEEIKKSNRVEMFDGNGGMNFNFSQNDFGNLKEQMQKMQEQMQKMMPQIERSYDDKNPDDSKEEIQKMKKELEEMKKDLEKTKSSLKLKKA